ncbi:MAG: NifU family protein [Candidatus Babeliales bacterium]
MVSPSHVDQIKSVLQDLRPIIARDGGDIEFVEYKDGIVYVRLAGACVGCPSSYFTLKMGVEEALKAQIPEIKEVQAVE